MRNSRKGELQNAIVPAVTAVILMAALILYVKYRALPYAVLLCAAALSGLLFNVNRNLEHSRDVKFYRGENERLALLASGRAGAEEYLRQEEAVLENLTSEAFLTYARMNLITGLLVAAHPQEALEAQKRLDVQTLDAPLLAMYCIARVDAFMQLGQREAAEEAYALACGAVEKSGRQRIKETFRLTALRYQAFTGEYAAVMEELDELPEDFTDASGWQLLRALRAVCLHRLDRRGELEPLLEKLSAEELPPFVAELLRTVPGAAA